MDHIHRRQMECGSGHHRADERLFLPRRITIYHMIFLISIIFLSLWLFLSNKTNESVFSIRSSVKSLPTPTPFRAQYHTARGVRVFGENSTANRMSMCRCCRNAGRARPSRRRVWHGHWTSPNSLLQSGAIHTKIGRVSLCLRGNEQGMTVPHSRDALDHTDVHGAIENIR